MKEWINHCDTTHQHIPPKQGCRPKRLIKIGGNDKSIGHLCSPPHLVKFAALSYRWGHGKDSETTKENVNDRFKALRTLEFPKTLQDAIQVTRGLDLEYIWIDRICIVQDDEAEWATEASLMADIYANAHIVLSATATEDPKDGFLLKRKAPRVIRYAQPGQGDRAVCARQVAPHDCRRKAQKHSYPLFQRGWCMQERFLARRIIHFLPDEVLFECEQGRECECGAANNEKTLYARIYAGYNEFRSLRAATEIPESFARDWMAIVHEYSRMELSYGRDSLPALSGLAACMGHLEPGEYIAGLWQHGIVFQLGWHIDAMSLGKRWRHPEDVDILGPTFSWSSHVRSTAERTPPRHAQSICTLEDFQVQAATSNPYGQVLHASLCLNGWVVLGDRTWSWLQTPAANKVDGCIYLDVGFAIDNRDRMVLGHSAENEKWRSEGTWRSVMCFALYCYPHYPHEELILIDALLLQRSTTRADEFTRIGVARGLEYYWYAETAISSRVTLV